MARENGVALLEQIQSFKVQRFREFLHDAQSGIAQSALDLSYIGDSKTDLVGQSLLTKPTVLPVSPDVHSKGTRQSHTRRRNDFLTHRQSL